ncbi:MAG: hypothetical protein KF733_09550 [Fimbriimonadaceae bacterium]|nr:MAG: hypothetical protein KF733_09550 [Fimbriimonadaceae bacterium]
MHFTPGGQATVQFSLSGIPDFVTLGNFSLPFSCQSIVTGLAGNAGTRLYLTDAKPLGSPYGRQLPVWTNVLEDACRFATGYAGATSVRARCTYNLFWFHEDPLEPWHYPIFVYDPDKPYWCERTQGPNAAAHYFKFYLTEFFAGRTPNNFYVNGDCQDVSFYLQIATSALGVPLKAIREFPVAPGYPIQALAFQTNPLCGVGNDATLPGNYTSFGFNFHQHNSFDNDTYDAACAQVIDLVGNNYYNPPIAWPLETPPQHSYWQTEVVPIPPIGPLHRGLTFSYVLSQNPQGEIVQRSLKQGQLLTIE